MANIGPSHDGRIGRIYEERLLQIGEFIDTEKFFNDFSAGYITKLEFY